jgi:hypothetical protein
MSQHENMGSRSEPVDFSHIADAPDILALVRKRLEEAGSTLDFKEQCLIWLALHSRWGIPCANIAVFGPPGVGKTSMVENVLKFFPVSVVAIISSMSPKALGYETESLKNRYIYLREYRGDGGPDENALLRDLIWDGSVRHTAVNKSSSGSNGLHKNTLEGPTGLITTTTKTAIHPENQSRMLCLHVAGTPERVAAIHALQASRAAGMVLADVDHSDFHAHEEWLDEQPHEVVIPYMPVLASMLYTRDTQMTRNSAILIGLLNASAIVHQRNRHISADGVIEATLDDYRIVYDLAADVFATAISESVPEDVRAVVEAYVSAANHRPGHKAGVPPKLVEQKLGLSGTAISRAGKEGIERGYLKNAEPYARRLNRVLPTGEALPQPTRVMPTPEELEEAIERAKAA